MSSILAVILVVAVVDKDPGGVGALQHEAEVDHGGLHVGDVQSHLVFQERFFMFFPVQMTNVKNRHRRVIRFSKSWISINM